MTTASLDPVRRRLEHAAEQSTTPVGLFSEVARALRAAIPLDGWCGHTLDPSTTMPTGGDFREGFAPHLIPRMLELEYAIGDVNPFNGLCRQGSPVGTILGATDGEPQRSARYRDVVAPSGFEHELRVVFRHQGRAWGAMVLLRAADAPAFKTTEAELLASVSTAMAVAIKRTLLKGHVEVGGLPEHPGLLLLGPDRAVETVTPEGQRWLEELRDGSKALPLSVVALASRAAESGGTGVRARARVASGAWVTLTAWSLGGGRTAISLESSAPHDLTALALDAYALSHREREVVELVLLGYSTGQIAERLCLSPYTVQDYLKIVFDKTGVRSRRELAADLFFRHYLPRIERGTPLTSDGWFAPDHDA